MIYNLCKKLIAQYKAKGQTEKLEEMQDKLDVYFAANRLTEEQYRELTELVMTSYVSA